MRRRTGRRSHHDLLHPAPRRAESRQPMTDINRPRTVALVDVSCLFKKNYEAMPGAGPREAAERTLSEFAAVREDTAHVILCLDAPRKEQPRYTRNAIYPEYKANRTAPSEQETAQKRWLLDRARKLGYQLARVEGWEADDVIATLARIYGEWCEEVRLVGDSVVKLWNTSNWREVRSMSMIRPEAPYSLSAELT